MSCGRTGRLCSQRAACPGPRSGGVKRSRRLQRSRSYRWPWPHAVFTLPKQRWHSKFYFFHAPPRKSDLPPLPLRAGTRPMRWVGAMRWLAASCALRCSVPRLPQPVGSAPAASLA
eukprot:5726608-Pyramimonas_sp.AAC.1